MKKFLKSLAVVLTSSIVLYACTKEKSLPNYEGENGVTSFNKGGKPSIHKLDTPYKSMRIDTPYKYSRVDAPYKYVRIDTPYKYSRVDTPYIRP